MGERKRRKTAGITGSSTPGNRRGSGGKGRVPWRAIGWFLLAMLLLDIVLFVIFQFGLGRCYGILCLI